MVLDTFPFPGGTTTAEALWMGVPTLTVSTPGMLGRQGVSLLANAGLEAWICHDVEAYVAKAIGWADAAFGTRQRLSDLRAGLRAQVQACPLFDAPRFAQHFGSAIREMWRIRCVSAKSVDSLR
jgi:predicted O-linked N-acetylglucosamine transferase (SPINDLY family)